MERVGEQPNRKSALIGQRSGEEGNWAHPVHQDGSFVIYRFGRGRNFLKSQNKPQIQPIIRDGRTDECGTVTDGKSGRTAK